MRSARILRLSNVLHQRLAYQPAPRSVALSNMCPNVMRSGLRLPGTVRYFGDVVVPELGGESITEGSLMEFSKNVGDAVNKDDVVAVIETDKVSIEVLATESGVVTEHCVDVDSTVIVGQPIAKIGAGSGAPAAAAATAPAAAASVAPTATPGATGLREGFERVHAQRSGASAVPAPSTPQPEAAPKAAPAAAAAAAPVEKVVGSRVERREKMSRMRQRIAQRLKEAQNTAACLTTFQEVDMSAAMALRKKYKDDFEKKHGSKFGFMSLFSKACAMALQEIPSANAQIDNDTKESIHPNFVDISVAVASPRGLVTPVLRNVEQMSLLDIEQELARLADRARNDKITMEEMSGGTFTISNGGIFGSLMGTPILNTPQTAILGMHAIKERPIVVNGKVEIRPMMYLALTYDHRIVDGREGVTFLVSVKNKIEDPARMLLDL